MPEALLTCLPLGWARHSHLLLGLSRNCPKGRPCPLDLGPPCFRGHSLSRPASSVWASPGTGSLAPSSQCLAILGCSKALIVCIQAQVACLALLVWSLMWSQDTHSTQKVLAHGSPGASSHWARPVFRA